MNIPTPQERKAMRKLYAQPKKIKHWEMVFCGKVVYESIWPALCDYHIKQYNLGGAFKKPIYYE